MQPLHTSQAGSGHDLAFPVANFISVVLKPQSTKSDT